MILGVTARKHSIGNHIYWLITLLKFGNYFFTVTYSIDFLLNQECFFKKLHCFIVNYLYIV